MNPDFFSSLREALSPLRVRAVMRWCACLLLLGCSRPDGAGARRLDTITPEEREEPFVYLGYRSPQEISLSNAGQGATGLLPPGNICLDGELSAVLTFGHAAFVPGHQNDGWGRPLRVHCGEAGVYVYSVGADGRSDTEDDLGFRMYWLSGSDPRHKRKARADEPEGTVYGAKGVSKTPPPSPIVQDGRVFLPPQSRRARN